MSNVHDCHAQPSSRLAPFWVVREADSSPFGWQLECGDLFGSILTLPITFCPFCGTELPSPPQPPRVVSGSWQEWDEVREAIAYAVSKGHAPPALIGKIMTAADWSQQPEPAQTEEDRQAWLARVTS